MERQIILFTDGSEGSIKATGLALELAEFYKSVINAFFIIDSSWGSLLGDEWISTSETRMRFFGWFEGELKAFAFESLEKVQKAAQARGVQARTRVLIGPVERLIIEQTLENPAALVVLPNPGATAPGAAAGLKYNISRLTKRINCPVLLGPK